MIEKCRTHFKIKNKFEFIDLKNSKRIVDKVKFNKNIDLSNLKTNERKYVKNEINALNNHISIESEQKIRWINNNSGNIFESQIVNVNTITHNESGEGIEIWKDSNNIQLYVNNINVKVCNTQNRLKHENIITKESELIVDYNDKLIETIDNRTADWFECMKTMNNDAHKCYNIMYWKENILKKTEFYLNNNINMCTIVENTENMWNILYL